jgi:Holliday junction resolvase RusA-like endonuclease
VAYKSAGQKSAEAVLDDLLSKRAPEKPLDGPLVLEFIAGMPIPASTSKKQREAMLRGEIAHTKKPDLDNMAKQLKDAMTRAGFWRDDKQVVALRCSKRYAAVPHWEVAVYTQEEA